MKTFRAAWIPKVHKIIAFWALLWLAVEELNLNYHSVCYITIVGMYFK